MKPHYLRDCEQGSRVTLASDGTPHAGHPVVVVGNYGRTTGVVVVRSLRDGATFERDGYTEVVP